MQGSREAVYASLRGLRNERSSSFFKLNDVHAAEIRRIGLERVIEAGLLPEILQYLNFGEVSFEPCKSALTTPGQKHKS